MSNHAAIAGGKHRRNQLACDDAAERIGRSAQPLNPVVHRSSNTAGYRVAVCTIAKLLTLYSRVRRLLLEGVLRHRARPLETTIFLSCCATPSQSPRGSRSRVP